MLWVIIAAQSVSAITCDRWNLVSIDEKKRARITWYGHTFTTDGSNAQLLLI
jgi:hypothetical protein